MKKIFTLLVAIIACFEANAQFGYTVIKHETFEPTQFETTFSRLNPTFTFAGTGCTSTYWNDMFCNNVTLPAIKDNTMNIVNSTANGGTQSLKIYVGPNVQAVATRRIRSNAGAYGYDGTTNLTGTTANTIGAWANYVITFYAKTDAGDPSEGKVIFPGSTQTLTSTWQRFSITNNYSSNVSQSTLFIDFAAINPAVGYNVYIDDIKILKTVQPTTNDATNITENSFVANWNAVADATSYSITVEKSDGGATPVWTAIAGSPFTSTTNSLNLTGLDANSAYRYKFTANDGSLTSIVSSIKQVTTSVATGLSNISKHSIYTANGCIYATTEAGMDITVYNNIGQQISKTKSISGINKVAVNAKGVVLVKVGTQVTKVVL